MLFCINTLHERVTIKNIDMTIERYYTIFLKGNVSNLFSGMFANDGFMAFAISHASMNEMAAAWLTRESERRSRRDVSIDQRDLAVP